MIIQYKILWVDDQIKEDALVHLIDQIKEHLENLGFASVIDQFEGTKEALDSLNETPKGSYDLILSDFHLGHEDNGDSLIKKIRNNEIYTEILFYSGQNDFEETAKSLYTDRLSFFSLRGDQGYTEFNKRITNLINLTVKKIQEVDNLRGVIIGAVSEMDAMIEKKLKEIFDDSKIEGIRNYAVRKISKKVEGNSQKISEIDENNVDQYLDNPNLFDVSIKSKILNEYIKKIKLQNEFKSDCKNFYENYHKNASKIRNKMAHWKKSTTEDNTIVNNDGTQETLGTEECIKLRIKINDLFKSIQSLQIE